MFKRGKKLPWLLAAFVLSLFVLVYFFLPLHHPWQLFLLAVPAVAIVFLACNVRKAPKHRKFIKKASK